MSLICLSPLALSSGSLRGIAARARSLSLERCSISLLWLARSISVLSLLCSLLCLAALLRYSASLFGSLDRWSGSVSGSLLSLVWLAHWLGLWLAHWLTVSLLLAVSLVLSLSRSFSLSLVIRLARGLALLQSRDLARVLAPYRARCNLSNFSVPFSLSLIHI